MEKNIPSVSPFVAKLVHFQFKGIMSSDIGIEVEKAGAWIILMEGGDLSRQITRETVRLQLQRKRREGGLRPPFVVYTKGAQGNGHRTKSTASRSPTTATMS